MLKIKDNVDLKELEKFGFKYSPEQLNHKEYYTYKKQVNGWGYETDVCVILCKDRIIGTRHTWELDVVFDLITAGLVDKVSD